MTETRSPYIEIPEPEGFLPFPDELGALPIFELIERWAKKEPGRLAVVGDGEKYSYGQLNIASNRVANGLLSTVDEGNFPVGILVGKETIAIFGLLGILKAGKCFVGLDPTSPVPYIESICQDLKLKTLLTTNKYAPIAERIKVDGLRIIRMDQWLENMPDDMTRQVQIPLDGTAAIFFTSGSTGKTKGVVVNHLALYHRIRGTTKSLKYSPTDRTCFPFHISYGWAPQPLMGTLTMGGVVFVFDYLQKTVLEIADWNIENQITVAVMPTSVVKQLVTKLPEDYPSKFPLIRLINSGGDLFTKDIIRLWQGRFTKGCFLADGYASTEVSPLAKAFYGTDTKFTDSLLKFGHFDISAKIFIVDENAKPLPIGERGEIAVRSKTTMDGYWNRPALTQQRFIADPEFPGEKILLSGDLGRLDEDGYLEFLGRNDAKVKIRGYLVDIKVVESALAELPAVSEVAVKTFQRIKGDAKLVAYLVFNQGEAISVQEIKQLLSEQLPSFMLPQSFQILDRLPYGTSGKVNTALLPELSNHRPDLSTPFQPPQDETEIRLAEIWERILEINGVGIEDNFFDLGGDSLDALEMSLEVEMAFSHKVPQVFFQKPTIQNLKTLLVEAERTPSVKDELRRFNLQSHRAEPGKNVQHGRTSERKHLQGKKLANRDTGNSLDRIVDLRVARHITTLPFQKANNWVLRWSRNSLVRALLYQRRYRLFTNLLKELHGDSSKSVELFQRSMITNLNYRLRLFKRENPEKQYEFYDIYTEMDNLTRSPSKYWSSLAKLISTTPRDQLDTFFPVNGIGFLTDAIASGKGVILLSFHGMITPLRFLPLKWRMEKNIITISYQIALSQSNIMKQDANVRSKRSTINAEIALFGHRILQEGGILNIIGDSSDPYGKEYQISVCGRAYPIKTGFAEMAINSGAIVLPYFGRVLDDGRQETNIFPPFENHGTIDQMMEQYQSFINHVWNNYPDAIRWAKIQKHFSQPEA